jgi:hypothetical protein
MDQERKELCNQITPGIYTSFSELKTGFWNTIDDHPPPFILLFNKPLPRVIFW